MKVNNLDIKNNFNADVVKFEPSIMEIENNIIEMDSSYNVLLGIQQLKPQIRTLIMDFYNEDDISNFTAEISSSFRLDIDDGYIYRCFVRSTPSITQEGICAFTYKVNVYALKRKELRTIHFNGNAVITNIGNCISDAVVKLSSNNAIECFVINDITCNLSANDTLIIDGIDKKIYYESNPEISAFDSVSMVSFPKLKRGENDIMVSDDSVDITLSYYPVFM